MELNLALNEKNLLVGLTQSELGMLDDCKMKWNLTYNNLLRRRGGWNWPMEVGTAFHSFGQTFYNSTRGKKVPFNPNLVTFEKPDEDVLLDDKFNADMEFWIGALGALQRGYARHWKDDLTMLRSDIVEEVVEKKYRGFNFTGKIDWAGTTPKAYGLMDHKTSSSLEHLTEEGWDFRLQFNFYPWLLSEKKPTVFIINGIRRPALRRTQTETLRAFINRTANDIAKRPLEYFRRTLMPINPERIRHFQETVIDPKLNFIEAARKNPDLLVNKNTNHCTAYYSTCPFLPICRDKFKGNEFMYTQRDVKHVELEIE